MILAEAADEPRRSREQQAELEEASRHPLDGGATALPRITSSGYPGGYSPKTKQPLGWGLGGGGGGGGRGMALGQGLGLGLGQGRGSDRYDDRDSCVTSETLMCIYREVHDPDAIYGVNLTSSLSLQAMAYAHAGQWLEAMATYDSMKKGQSHSHNYGHSYGHMALSLPPPPSLSVNEGQENNFGGGGGGGSGLGGGAVNPPHQHHGKVYGSGGKGKSKITTGQDPTSPSATATATAGGGGGVGGARHSATDGSHDLMTAYSGMDEDNGSTDGDGLSPDEGIEQVTPLPPCDHIHIRSVLELYTLSYIPSNPLPPSFPPPHPTPPHPLPLSRPPSISASPSLPSFLPLPSSLLPSPFPSPSRPPPSPLSLPSPPRH